MMRSASAPSSTFRDTKSAPASSVAQFPSLYATPSYCSLFAEPEDPEPGPGAYEVLSSIGRQPESTKASGPQSSLTAKHSKAWSKVLISKHHNQELLCRDSPAAGTYDPVAIKTQAAVKFGTGKRTPVGDFKERSPGPVYDLRGRPDVDFNVKFGQDDRFKADGEPTLGPGTYEALTSFDGTRLAKTFGVSYKSYAKVRTPGFERELYGRESPGPGAFRLDFGRNLPQHTFSGVRSFPRADRMPHRKRGVRVPGPGTYNHADVLEVAKCSCASSEIRNVPCRTFGKPSTKPRLDFKAMRIFDNSTWGLN